MAVVTSLSPWLLVVFLNENVFLCIVSKLFAVKVGIGLKEATDSEAIAVDAKDVSVLTLDWIVVAVVFTAKVEFDASGLEDLLVTSTI